jgi:hypothetical protein
MIGVPLSALSKGLFDHVDNHSFQAILTLQGCSYQSYRNVLKGGTS